MMGGYGVGMGVGWVVMGLFWVLLIAAIVWLVVSLVRSGHRTDVGMPVPPPATGFGPASAPSSLELLDRRLAAGEIDLATYQQVRATLRESGTR
ncbi:hypothetical protein CELL_00048 [Cellulomonas sp. T2.31MG-18]|uniref:SHOCT domain-containing protein n=1 Tax=Cellulomonas sp. T2.31MG-18 TaxID=3157619 RepID=UPI0035E735B2